VIAFAGGEALHIAAVPPRSQDDSSELRCRTGQTGLDFAPYLRYMPLYIAY